MVRVGISGAAGRMGRTLIEATVENKVAQVGAITERAESTLIGADAGELASLDKLNVNLVGQLNSVLDDFDVLIDFTHPTVTLQNLEICRAAKKRMVIGTTGFTVEQRAQLEEAAKDMAIVFAPNRDASAAAPTPIREDVPRN